MQSANLFFLVSDLARARVFYDLLLNQEGVQRNDSLRYNLLGLELHFHQLRPDQARRYRLRTLPSRERPRQGICLRAPDWSSRLGDLQKAGARCETPWAAAPWGGYTTQLSDPSGYRWELASPAAFPPAPASTHHDETTAPSR